MSKHFTDSIAPTLIATTAARVAERCDQLAQHSDDPSCLSRTFCSPAMKTAHQQLAGWFDSVGMDSTLDAAGNLIGHYAGTSESAAKRSVFMIGSHLDTVVNAGRFDGILGVLLGLGVADVLHEAGVRLPFDLDVVAFSEEEGVRFGFPFIGSRAIAGSFNLADLDCPDGGGITVRQALMDFGCTPEQMQSASYRKRNVLGFLEAHLEQAVVLEESQMPVGVVSAIAGQTRASIILEGMSGHAGTVPHDRRQDAIAAAASLILKIEELGQQTDGLFATVGRVIAAPGLSNVIAGHAEMLLDLRHASDEVRMDAFKTIKLMTLETAKFRNVAGVLTSVQHSPAVPMDTTLSGHLLDAVKAAGLNPSNLVSGAGHDAMVMAQLAPSCMLFVRCKDGVSHHPDEFVSPDDIAVALDVMVTALMRLADSSGS